MVELGLSPGEFREVLGACAAIGIHSCPAPYLKEFLIGRLAERAARLADKISLFNEEQMELLCELIREQQGLLR